MALDEPKDTDSTYEIDGFTYVVDQAFLEKVKPIKVDFSEIGFKVSANIDLGATSECGGCGSSSNCCST